MVVFSAVDSDGGRGILKILGDTSQGGIIILDFCERFVWRPGTWVSWRWWEQEGIDVEGVREIATAALDG